jgi:PAS domain S-box-containing protein
MNLKTLPYRALQRHAVLLLLPMLCVATWALYHAITLQRQVERDDLDRLLLQRAQRVEKQLEQTLQLAAFAASGMRHPALQETGMCTVFLNDLIAIQPAISGAALRDGHGSTVCSSRDAPERPLSVNPEMPWNLQPQPDGSLQLDHLVAESGDAPVGQVSLRIDAQAIINLAEPGEETPVAWLHWVTTPAEAQGASPAPAVELRGQVVAFAVPEASAPGTGVGTRLGLPVVAAGMLGCVVLAMVAVVWIDARMLRDDSERLMQVARHPEEGDRIRARMLTGRLANAADVIATEQRSARELNEQLRQTTARLEEVQRVASIGSWRADLAAGTLEWSAQAHIIFGLSDGEKITWERLFSMVHPDDRIGRTGHHETLVAGLADMDCAYRIERTGGEERVVHERGTVAARDEAGRPTALVGTVQDVTEAWEATGLNDALTRALALSDDPVLLTREHAGIWLWAWSNRAWDRLCEQLRLDGREADHQLFNPDSGLLRAHVTEARDARAQHQVLRLELSFVLPQGHCWYDAELIPQFSAPGRPGHGLLRLRDRSAERKAALVLRDANSQLEHTVRERTEALARSERQYRVLADLSPQVLWQAGPGGEISYLNHAWYKLVGDRDGGWLGLRWLDALHPDDVAPSVEAVATGVQLRQPWHLRRRVKAKGGGYRSLLSAAAPMLDRRGEVESWTGVDTDITELEQHASRLQQLNEELETFSYTVSHDLRAPVHVIKGFVDALLSGQIGQIDAEAQHYLGRVLSNARRMDDLITDLLALARLARETPQLQRFDPGVLAHSLIPAIQERYPDRIIECHTEGGGLHIEADLRLFQVVLENLLDNAAKFTAGQPTCRIEMTWRAEREEAVIELADNGVGFPEDFAHRLFRPYQRLHGKDRFPGHGIGLATVARIVQRHGGSVSAHNRAAGGAIFRIRLPLTNASVVAVDTTETR